MIQVLSRRSLRRARGGVGPRLAALTMLAFGLRLWGIGFGLPWHLHPDEPAHVLEPLAVAHGVPHALSFANPPLYKYLLLGVYNATVGLSDPQNPDASQQFIVARATSAGLGALTVLPMYWLASTLGGRRAGLIAAALTAVAYLLVRESHFAVNDALVTLCVALALLGSLRVMCGGARREYLLTGVVVGLAFAAKYQGLAVVMSLVLAHALRQGPRRHADLLVAMCVAVVAALVVFPSLFLEPGRVLADFYVFDVLPARLGYDGMEPGGGYRYYVAALGVGLGWPMVTLAGVGTVRAAVSRDRRLLLLASLPVVLFVGLGAARMYFARFLLPAVPALIVVTAVLLNDLFDSPRVAAKLLGAVGLALTVAWTAADSLRFDLLLGREDTRLQAAVWIQRHLPGDARLAVDGLPFGPPLPQAVRTPAALYDLSLDEYRRAGIEYIVTSSFVAEGRPIDPSRDEQRRAFYAALQRQSDTVIEFRPAAVDVPFVYDRIYAPFDALSEFSQPGPTINVYHLTRRPTFDGGSPVQGDGRRSRTANRRLWDGQPGNFSLQDQGGAADDARAANPAPPVWRFASGSRWCELAARVVCL